MTAIATPAPKSVPGEIADALVSILESAPVQDELVLAIKSGEVTAEALADNAISAAKGSGPLGLVIAATKGTVETQVNAYIAAQAPEKIAAWLTGLAQEAAKKLGG